MRRPPRRIASAARSLPAASPIVSPGLGERRSRAASTPPIAPRPMIPMRIRGARVAEAPHWAQGLGYEVARRGGGAMAKEFEGKVALVTGGSRGIGRAVAVRLAEGGCAIALGYAGNEAKAACEKAGAARVRLIKFDVADPEACAKAVDEVVKELGGLHVLVNNAGISIDGLILRYKADDLRRVLDVDLASAFHLSKAAVRPMMKQRGGSIVNLTSVVGEQGNAGQTAYAAAKAGLIGLTKALAREVGSRNIRVNAVSPGWIETDMTRDLPEEAKKSMIEGAALGRAGSPREVAEAIAFLASERASFITGEVLRVNGGLYM